MGEIRRTLREKRETNLESETTDESAIKERGGEGAIAGRDTANTEREKRDKLRERDNG